MNFGELDVLYLTDCSRCGTEATARNWRQDFTHDLKCWGLKCALHNLWFRVRGMGDM